MQIAKTGNSTDTALFLHVQTDTPTPDPQCIWVWGEREILPNAQLCGTAWRRFVEEAVRDETVRCIIMCDNSTDRVVSLLLTYAAPYSEQQAYGLMQLLGRVHGEPIAVVETVAAAAR